ncbi:HPr kinase/phosphorylase [Allorhizobium undicola]|uniref:HPr kinase/phosphorylase n=1 Tax=Allorhizobium undicola TaxID=78527 RepID=UPI000484E468|nr:hypothetical protein [Allorhizobium undicola]
MKNKWPNIHATAIEIGGCGFLICGPSGAGKSRLALELLSLAAMAGVEAALVADDQVLVEIGGQGEVIAHRPAAIEGLIEARFTGILRLPSIPSSRIGHVILPLKNPGDADRLPPENERFEVVQGVFLPVIRLLPGMIANLTVLRLRAGFHDH